MPGLANITDKYVGSRVRMRRLMLDLSQTELANALGVSFQQIQKYEKGANRISASSLQQIASFLQVPVSFFFEGLSASNKVSSRTGDGRSPGNIAEFTSTSEGLTLARSFMQIKDKKLRRCIVRLVEALNHRDS